MALGGTDLNLLVALKVLLEEGNVTRAGKRLHMSQPSMSGALARLRRQFDDELLTRNGREFELTPFARELLPEVQRSLSLISAALQVDEAFDPPSSDRVFRLSMSDYALAIVHEPLLRSIRTRAPHIRLEIDPMPVDAQGSDRALVDFDAMIGPTGYGFAGESRPLFRDRMVCLVDKDNPRAAGGRLTMQDLREMPHVVASFGLRNLTPVDRMFGERQIDRQLGMVVSGWLPVPFALEGTEMVAVVPERLARIHSADGRLATIEPPFGQVLLVESYWFAQTRTVDPAYRWLYARLDDVATELTGNEPEIVDP